MDRYEAIAPVNRIGAEPPPISLPNLLNKLEIRNNFSLYGIFQELYSSLRSMFGYSGSAPIMSVSRMLFVNAYRSKF